MGSAAAAPCLILRSLRASPRFFAAAGQRHNCSATSPAASYPSFLRCSRFSPGTSTSPCGRFASPLLLHFGAGRASDVSVRSFQVSGPGAVDSPLMTSMKQKISEALSTEEVVVQDMQGDGRHVSIQVVAEIFEGKRSVERQRMVYKAIWEELQGAVHAVDQLITLAPSEKE